MSALTAIDVEGGNQELSFGKTLNKIKQDNIDIEELSYEDLSEDE